MPVSTGVPYELSPNGKAGLVPEGGRGKLFESREIAECIWIKGALMRAKPRCGHGMSFPKEHEGKAANCLFEAADNGSLASQQFQLPQQISLATVVRRF
jgi:hypothetical protein